MYSLSELAAQYGRQAEALHIQLRAARRDAARENDPASAYLLRRRVVMLTEMWRDTRDIGLLLAHYYDGAPSGREAHGE